MVVWKKLGDCIISLKTGLNPRKNFVLNSEGSTNYYITVRELDYWKIIPSDKTDKVDDDAIRVINNRSNLEEGDVLFSGTGTIGRTALVKETPKNWNIKEGVYTIKPKKELLNSKFLIELFHSYYLINKINEFTVGDPIRSVPMKNFVQIQIPVPSLSEQKHIVGILDTFTSSIENLKEQIAQRRKQYEYYRDQLLDLEGKPGVEMKTLGDFGDVTKLAGFEFTEHVIYKEEGKIIALRGLNVRNGNLDLSQIKYIDGSNFEKLGRSKLLINDMLFTYVGTIGNVALINEDDKYYLAPNVSRIRFDCNVIIPRFALYVFMSEYFHRTQINKFLNSSSMKNLSMENIRKFKLPLPPLSEQQRIVSILDTFEASIQNLEAQLNERQKQYEYYRNKLLTFE